MKNSPSGNFTRLFGRLSLGVIEVGGNPERSLGDFLTEVLAGIISQFS